MKKKLVQTRKIVEHLTTTYESYVSFHEADPLGIVWHGNYIKFFERGREEFGRQNGLDYGGFYENGFATPIVNVNCNYFKSLKYGDYYKVRTSIVKTVTAKIILNYEVYNKEGELMCEGETTQVFVSREGELALYAPSFYIEWQQKVKYSE